MTSSHEMDQQSRGWEQHSTVCGRSTSLPTSRLLWYPTVVEYHNKPGCCLRVARIVATFAFSSTLRRPYLSASLKSPHPRLLRNAVFAVRKCTFRNSADRTFVLSRVEGQLYLSRSRS